MFLLGHIITRPSAFFVGEGTMALIFKSVSDVAEELDPRPEPKSAKKARSAVPKVPSKDTRTKGPAPRAAATLVPPTRRLPGPETSRKRKEVQTQKPLSRGEKGKGVAIAPEVAKKPKKGPGISLHEPTIFVQVPCDQGLRDHSDVERALDPSVDQAAEEVWDPSHEWREFVEAVVPDQEKATGVI